MKKQFLIASALFISVTVFGQKDEIKSAEKAIKSEDFATAIQSLKQAEGLMANADDKTKAKIYYLKGIALYGNGKGKVSPEVVGTAFNELIAYEKQTNSNKYTAEIGGLLNELVKTTADAASKNYTTATESKEPADYVKSAKMFEQVYKLSPADTSYLDNAALVYYLGKDFKSSINAYSKLLELGYTGVAKEFIATNKATGEEVTYADKKSMDLQVKLGMAENPKEEVKDSRRELIFKNLALNYSEMEEVDKALEVITEGRKEFPKSYALLIDEANIYYKKGDNNAFKERLETAIELNPTEPTLYYNVGVMNMGQKKSDEAIKYFNKAIELKPNYSEAYNNIGAAILDKAAPIVEEMNKNLTDFKKYDALQIKQKAVYKEAIPYFEKAYEINKNEISTVQNLLGLYENLGMDDKAAAMKEIYEKLKG
ncbi:MAG: tetratricopeptide repeat protein [Lutibacter sp.]|nr:tetratricopeptide repeat protein [Lutibacter sp.]MBP9601161.1 tetratricopeptide repeat protein [Lutibacter sp.]